MVFKRKKLWKECILDEMKTAKKYFAIGLAIGCTSSMFYYLGKALYCYIMQLNQLAEKYRCYNNLLHEWLQKKNRGISLEPFFLNRGWNKIAIYGMGDLGCRLCEELGPTSVQMLCGIDQNKKNVFSEVSVIGMDDEIPDEIDAVVVTPYLHFASIKAALQEKGIKTILSLEDIIYQVY